MSTFTVYCHGTGFNRKNATESNELVAWFHNNTQGAEVIFAASTVSRGDYLINEGPGHNEGEGIAQPQQINPLTGDRKRNLSLAKVVTRPSFKDHLSGRTGGPQLAANARGNLTGAGWDENVIRTINVIQDLKFGQGQPIDKVNMVGWSRGAVTCMRIANRMYEIFGDEIKCNIFAIDPVAGMDAGTKMADTQVLQSNVERYVGILAMHEMRSTFKPQDWSRIRAPATTAIFLPMPGVHSAQVIVGSPPEAAYITRNLACGLLRDWGTVIKATPYNRLRSAERMCESYAELVQSLSEHKSYQSRTAKDRLIGMGLRRREFATHSKMDTYTRGGKESYWINEHHRACFAKAFPDVYDFIFESRGNGKVSLTRQSRYSSFFKAAAGSPVLRRSLTAKGLLQEDSPDQYSIQEGGGYYPNQSRRSWPEDFPLHA